MVWEATSSSNTKVVAKVNGEEKTFSYGGDMKLKDVVAQVASSINAGTVLVYADGREVQSNEGETAISSFRTIEVVPKQEAA